MENFKKSCVIAWLEVCQWKNDSRAWMVFILEAILVMRSMIGLAVYGIVNDTRTTPWVVTLLFADLTIARSLIKILLYLGVIVLFCNAPAINHMTPSVLLRGKRNAWIWGEIGYIFLGSALFILFLCILSIVCVLPSATLSEIWGSSLYQIGTGDAMERIQYISFLLLPSDLLNKIYPEYAMGYTLLTGWLSFSFIGLLIMAIHVGTGKKGAGIAAATILVMIDPAVAWLASWGPVNAWLFLFSPVSWVSMEHLQMVSGAGTLSFAYVVGMSLLFIVLLVIFILWKARKMEIEIL